MRGVTPELLQCVLESRVMEHMEACLHNPVFSMASNMDGSSNLMISCKVSPHLQHHWVWAVSRVVGLTFVVVDMMSNVLFEVLFVFIHHFCFQVCDYLSVVL